MLGRKNIKINVVSRIIENKRGDVFFLLLAPSGDSNTESRPNPFPSLPNGAKLTFT